MTARRVTFAAAELLGYDRTGGAGTATTFLAVALARRGHDVDILYVGKPRERAMGPDWEPFYAENGVAVRVPSYGDERFESPLFARMHAVERALAADPPDVVVTHEFWAPAYTALRLRQLGLGFERTLFVAFCHGTWRWTKDVNRNVRAHPDVLRESVIDQAGVELADVAVSPSAYLLDWMRDEGWLVPGPGLRYPVRHTLEARRGRPRHDPCRPTGASSVLPSSAASRSARGSSRSSPPLMRSRPSCWARWSSSSSAGRRRRGRRSASRRSSRSPLSARCVA